MELEDRIREHLTARSMHIDPSPPLPVDSINIEGPQQRGPWLAVGAAAAVLVVIGGLGIAGRSSGPSRFDEGTEATTASTDSPTTATTHGEIGEEVDTAIASTIAVAEGSLSADPLEFNVLEGGPGVDFIRSVAHHDGTTYAVGNVRSGNRTVESSVWSTTDGIAWARVSSFPAGLDTFVGGLVANDNGLVAIGSRLDGSDAAVYLYATASQTLVWSSPDGVTWSEAVLKSDVQSVIPTVVFGALVASDGDRMVAMGMEQPNVEALLFDRLPEDIRGLIESEAYGIGWGGMPFQVTVHGPGGLIVFSGGAEELRLTEEETAAINEMMMGSGPEEILIWISDDGHEWTQVASPPMPYLHGLTSAPDGGFLAVGDAMWSSPDGVEWERLGGANNVNQLIVEGDRILATVHGGRNGHIGEWNGDHFVRVSPLDAFSGPESWYLNSFTASDLGLAAVAMGYDQTEMDFRGPPAVSVEASNGRIVELDEMSGTMTVLEGGETLIRVHLGGQVADAIEFDIDAGTVTIADPDGGEVLAVIGIEDLNEAQHATYQQADSPESRTAVLFTSDGVNWSSTDLSDVVGPGFNAEQVILVGNAVVVLGREVAWYNYDLGLLAPYQVLVATP